MNHQNLRRCGITLLEIIFSILILAGSMAVLSGLSRTALLNARRTKEMTQAQFLCESILAEIQMGILELEPVFDEPVRDFPDTGATNLYDPNEVLWNYSLETCPIHDYGLVEVIVTVTKNETSSRVPVSYRLVRWVIDKEILDEALAERDSTSASTSSDGSSSNPSDTSSGGTTP